jgi:hypothetical protein
MFEYASLSDRQDVGQAAHEGHRPFTTAGSFQEWRKAAFPDGPECQRSPRNERIASTTTTAPISQMMLFMLIFS